MSCSTGHSGADGQQPAHHASHDDPGRRPWRARPLLSFPASDSLAANLLFTYYMLGLLCPTHHRHSAGLPGHSRAWAGRHHVGIILPQVAFQLPLSVLILRNFFTRNSPGAGRCRYVDGGSAFQFFWQIFCPWCGPGLAAVAVMTMVFSWNNFFLPLVTLNSEDLWTLPLGADAVLRSVQHRLCPGAGLTRLAGPHSGQSSSISSPSARSSQD